MDTRIRSIVKAVSWRLVGTLITFLVTYLVTRNIQISIVVGVLVAAINIGVYYAHERAWGHVRWGAD